VAKHASAQKAHRQSLKHREQNRQFRARLRSALKAVRIALGGDDLPAAKAALRETISLIDKLAAKRIIHQNAANRHKARLSKRLTAKSAA
jgi:small subunit ribosomal protein S20